MSTPALLALDTSGLDLAGDTRVLDDTGKADTGVSDTAGAVVDLGTYEFQGTTDLCPADWNMDLIFNTSDFIAYLGDYNAVDGGGTYTHQDPDIADPIGVLNTADVVAFLGDFTTGCP